MVNMPETSIHQQVRICFFWKRVLSSDSPQVNWFRVGSKKKDNQYKWAFPRNTFVKSCRSSILSTILFVLLLNWVDYMVA